MPRRARELSDSGVYHIFARGNNGNNIFIDDQDKDKYISLVKAAKEKYPISVYSYCIMDNHVHLLLRAEGDLLSRVMKSIQQSYTYYFNKKYNRYGVIFDSRFSSKACNDDSYLLGVIKYIHLNPDNANLSKSYINRFTSHMFYLSNDNSFCDCDYILGYFSDDINRAIELYNEFLFGK